jgi:hypothetical protein
MPARLSPARLSPARLSPARQSPAFSLTLSLPRDPDRDAAAPISCLNSMVALAAQHTNRGSVLVAAEARVGPSLPIAGNARECSGGDRGDRWQRRPRQAL